MTTFILFAKLFFKRIGRRKSAVYSPAYATPDLVRIQHPDPSKIQITWVGHTTFLIQVAGLNILTDPIWSNRASPVSWAGPRRQSQPGIALSRLPYIDLCLISHSHYDHLDRPTIQKLKKSPHYVTPPHLKRWFAKLGILNVTELLWWKSTTVGDVRITAVPAKHWSRRSLWEKESAGWCGYVLETPAGVIYFAGDTGYEPTYFKEIGKRFTTVDVALIPIGAYYPQEVFGRHHVDPKQAVVLHQEVGAKQSVGMHWGAFKLTQEPLDEPPVLLQHEVREAGLHDNAFIAMKIGETKVV